MLTIAGGIILAVIGLCALPFVLAIVWLIAPYALAIVGCGLGLMAIGDHDLGLGVFALILVLGGSYWLERREAAY